VSRAAGLLLFFLPAAAKQALLPARRQPAAAAPGAHLPPEGCAATATMVASLGDSVAGTVFYNNAVEYTAALLTENANWLRQYGRCSTWPQRRTVARYHAISLAAVALELAANFGVRCAGAAAGHRVMAADGVGAFWGEHLLLFAASRYIVIGTRAVTGAVLARVQHWFPLPDAAAAPADGRPAAEAAEGFDMADDYAEGQQQQQQGGGQTGAAPGDDATAAEAGERFNAQDREDIYTDADYYKTLGVPAAATPTEVKKTYRKKALLFHPDRVRHLSAAEQDAASATFKDLTTAYGVLGDEAKRAAYDAYRGSPAAYMERAMRGDHGAAATAAERLHNLVPRAATAMKAAPLPVQGAVVATFAWGFAGATVSMGASHARGIFTRFTAPGRGIVKARSDLM
jgi:DnaJ-domain-containing protein 1